MSIFTPKYLLQRQTQMHQLQHQLLGPDPTQPAIFQLLANLLHWSGQIKVLIWQNPPQICYSWRPNIYKEHQLDGHLSIEFNVAATELPNILVDYEGHADDPGHWSHLYAGLSLSAASQSIRNYLSQQHLNL